MQLGEKGKDEKYKKFGIESLKTNLLLIFKFLKEASEQRPNTIKCSVIRQNQERREMLLKSKKRSDQRVTQGYQWKLEKK